MRLPGFIGASYNLPNKSVDAQRCINMFVQKTESGLGKEQEQFALRRTPGLLAFVTLAGGRTRGGWRSSDGQAFAVGGNKLYSISSLGVATELGTLNTSSGRVSMADNGTYLAVVDGSQTLYLWNINTTTFSTKSVADGFEGAEMVSYDDGYFTFTRSDRYFISGVDDVTLDLLDFITSEASPDAIVGHAVANRQVFIFNEFTTEIFFDNGAADFPFVRMEGGTTSTGCAARASIAVLKEIPYWIGKGEHGEGVVYRANGATPERISTHAIEEAIQSYATISDAEAYCYEMNGHAFYVLNFPGADTTWAFNATTGAWHELAYASDGDLGRHRATWHLYAFGKHLVGDYANGKVYELTLAAKTDDGAPIIRRRICPHFTADLNGVTCHRLQIDLETGVGIDGAGQGDDPVVMLRVSKDGGYTWSNELQAGIGKIGKRGTRAFWNMLGMARDWVFEVSISDPVDVIMLGAEADFERMAS